MALWIAFWTALWVGSSRLTRWVIDWLCNARPKTTPTAAKSPKEGEQPKGSAGEQQADNTTKPPAKAPPADAEGSALLRWFGILAACFAAKALPYTTILAGALATAWVLTALALGYIAALPAKPKPTEDSAEQPADEPAAAEEHPRDLLDLGHVAQLLADVYTEGSGVHLATLAEHLSRTPLLGLPATPWETRDVRALMARHKVRVRDGVRVPPKGGREGVHRNDFPPLPRTDAGPTVVGVVVPGQSNNNNASNTPAFTITDDPDHPARHTVHHTVKGVSNA